MTLTVGSLFAGIGGFDLGLETTNGFETRWQVEVDPHCLGVLARHWPEVARHGDVRTLDPRDLEPVDLICGGFPCQDISNAGKRAGLSGEHSGLWREMLQAICVVRPRYALVENVAALLGRGMGTVQGDLAEIGYDTEWDCLRAADVGAPHRRERVFIVAYAASRELPGSQRETPGRDGLGPHGEVVANPDGGRCGTAESDLLSGRGEPDFAGRGSELAHSSLLGRRARRAEPEGLGGESGPGGHGVVADAAESGLPFTRPAGLSQVGQEGQGGMVPQPQRCGQLADAYPIGRDGRAGQLGQGRRGEPADGGQELADADGLDGVLLRHGPASLLGDGPQETEGQRDQPGSVEPDLGRNAYGLPAWLDRTALNCPVPPEDACQGCPWPARPGEPQHPCEPPRVARGVPRRVARIRALGNAVVPHVAYVIGLGILAVEAGLADSVFDYVDALLAGDAEVAHA